MTSTSTDPTPAPDPVEQATEDTAPAAPAVEPDPPAEVAPPGTVRVTTPSGGVLNLSAKQRTFNDEQLDLLRSTPVQVEGEGALKPPDLVYGLYQCQRLDLDPWMDVVFMRTENDVALIIKIAKMRRIAEATGEFMGATPVQWGDEEGTWHDLWPRHLGRPYAARVGVRRRGYSETSYSVVYTHEVEVYTWETVTEMVGDQKKERRVQVLAPRWRDGNGVLQMVGKCALAAALRNTFPETGGTYISEEMQRVREQSKKAHEAAVREEATEARRQAFAAAKKAEQSPAPAPAGPVVAPEVLDLADGTVVAHQSRYDVVPAPVNPMDAVAQLRARVGQRVMAETAANPASEVVAPAAPAARPPVPTTSAQRADLLRAELAMQAEAMGAPLEVLTRRFAAVHGPLEGWPEAIVAKAVLPLRGTAHAALVAADRHDEAGAYWAFVGTDHVDHVSVLLGH